MHYSAPSSVGLTTCIVFACLPFLLLLLICFCGNKWCYLFVLSYHFPSPVLGDVRSVNKCGFCACSQGKQRALSHLYSLLLLLLFAKENLFISPFCFSAVRNGWRMRGRQESPL
uniref:Uncharacterized protein n=1 Tax=Trypanosoma congolense (strain IL3000) TaxID=1068625 RepID=G0ULJ8_TRYCI|nr:hypothetical protein, unlikely [Trypanosoma congolense IL3000]